VVTRLMVISLCLVILSTVTGCYVKPTPYGTSYGVGAYQGESSGEGQTTTGGKTGDTGGNRMKCIIRGTALVVTVP